MQRLRLAQEQLQEAEEHAESTRINLVQQREWVMRSVVNVRDVNEELDQSNRLLTKMS
jgi:signal transduction histidine kinase